MSDRVQGKERDAHTRVDSLTPVCDARDGSIAWG